MKELMLMSPLDDRAGEMVSSKEYPSELLKWAELELKGIKWSYDKIKKLFVMAQNDEYPGDDVPDEVAELYEKICSDIQYAYELENDIEEDGPDEIDLEIEAVSEETQLVESVKGIELGSFHQKFDLGNLNQCVPRGNVTLQDWVGAFGFGVTLESGAQWIIGDAVVALQDSGHDDVVNQLCSQFKKSYPTVSGYVRTCRSYKPEVRDPSIPFTAYREIANADLPESKKLKLIEVVKQEKLSSSEVRERVKAEQGKSPQLPLGHRYLCLNVSNTSNSEVLRHVPENIEPHHLIIDLASKSWLDAAENEWIPFLKEK
jgi:hypothetical protein